MKSRKLFWTRLKQNWNRQYQTWKTVVDWTVLVYFVIPGLVISLFVYRSWWMQIPPWMEDIPFAAVYALFFLLLWGNHFLTYVREADRVFLKKNDQLLLGLKQWGLSYSYGREIIYAASVSVALAPFWFQHFQLTGIQLVWFASSWVTLKWLIMAVKGRLNVHLRGWRVFVRGIPFVVGALMIWELSYRAFTAGSAIWLAVIMIVNTIASILLIRPRFTSTQTLEQDLAIDNLEKQKYIEMIFGMSMDMEKLPKPKPIRTKPRLYSHSKRIFTKRTPKNGFLELFIKVTTRNTEYLKNYLKLIAVTSVALVIVPPLWLKPIIVGAGALFLPVWIGSVWHKVIGSHPFTKKYAIEGDYGKAKTIVTTVLIIPFFLFIGIVSYLRLVIFNYLLP